MQSWSFISVVKLCCELLSFCIFDLLNAVIGVNQTITRVSMFKADDLISLEDSFYLLLGMTSFNCPFDLTRNVTNFDTAWRRCESLTTFPLIDTSSGTNFDFCWYRCYALESFPLIDVGATLSLRSTWQYCSSLITFPHLNTAHITSFDTTWSSCSGLMYFSAIDTSGATMINLAWNHCTSLEFFPRLDFSGCVSVVSAWESCSALKCFPALDFSSVTNGADAFLNTTALISPAATGTSVRNGDDATVGAWTNPSGCPANFFMLVKTTSAPSFKNVTGGTLTITNLNNGFY